MLNIWQYVNKQTNSLKDWLPVCDWGTGCEIDCWLFEHPYLWGPLPPLISTQLPLSCQP